MLFGMVEQGIEAEVVGDKGKLRTSGRPTNTVNDSDAAMWAIILTKELWRKRIWYVDLQQAV